MPLKEFWHGDMRLLQVYEKAYVRDVSLRAWYQGYYSYIGDTVNSHNMWKNKGTKDAEFPKYVDPMERYSKPKITKENIEDEFRKQQIMQQDWLFKR